MFQPLDFFFSLGVVWCCIMFVLPNLTAGIELILLVIDNIKGYMNY